MDPLGRVVWGLDVAADRGLWVDHRNHTYCRLDGPLDLAFLPLGPLSLSALPPLLLGRLPAPPADAASATPGGTGTLTYRDPLRSAQGRPGALARGAARTAAAGGPAVAAGRLS